MIGKLFSLITGILGLVADCIGIGVFFFTVPPIPHSSSYITEDVVIAFVMLYGWISLSFVMIYHAMQKEPWKSKVKQKWIPFITGSQKLSLAMTSTYSIGLLIWPIMVAFVAMIFLQIPKAAENADTSVFVSVMILECIFIPIAILFFGGMMMTFMQVGFMTIFEK